MAQLVSKTEAGSEPVTQEPSPGFFSTRCQRRARGLHGFPPHWRGWWMELLYQHGYGSTPGASFASPNTGHLTEQGTQPSLLAFSLDVTQQVLHEYSVSTAGMRKCGLFLLYHPLPSPLPLPLPLPHANVQEVECRGVSRRTHLCPLDNCRECALCCSGCV